MTSFVDPQDVEKINYKRSGLVLGVEGCEAPCLALTGEDIALLRSMLRSKGIVALLNHPALGALDKWLEGAFASLAQ